MAYSKPVIWAKLSPSSGDTVNIPIADPGTTVNVIIKNPSLLALLNFSFPISNVPDGQVVKIAARSAITLVTMNVESGGVIWGALSGLLGGGSGIYQFDLADKTWYKFSG